MNWDLTAGADSSAEVTGALAEAAQRALSGRPVWTPADAAAGVRAELLPLWPGVPPTAARDALVQAAELAVDGGVVGVPEPLASWPTEAMLSAVGRTQKPDPPWPGMWSPLDVAVMVAFDETAEDATLQALAVLLTLAYAPGAAAWRPWRCLV